MATSERKRYSSRVRSEAGHLLPAAGLLGALLVWFLITEFGSGVVTNFHPVDTAVTLVELLSRPSFYDHIWVSLYRFFIALLLCSVIGFPVGIAVGYFTAVEQATTVLFQFLRMISPLAWFPIAIIFFGVGNGAAIFVMVMAGVWPILLNTAHGVATVEPNWLEVATSLGGDSKSTIWHVSIPAVIPEMLTGLRLAVGILWIILVPAEMLGVNTGLGYYILDARDRFEYAEIPAVMVIIGAIGYVFDRILRELQARYRWQ